MKPILVKDKISRVTQNNPFDPDMAHNGIVDFTYEISGVNPEGERVFHVESILNIKRSDNLLLSTLIVKTTFWIKYLENNIESLDFLEHCFYTAYSDFLNYHQELHEASQKIKNGIVMPEEAHVRFDMQTRVLDLLSQLP